MKILYSSLKAILLLVVMALGETLKQSLLVDAWASFFFRFNQK